MESDPLVELLTWRLGRREPPEGGLTTRILQIGSGAESASRNSLASSALR
jgi:hypothetical protein